MTAVDRFDPFERRISDAIDEIASARPPEYLNDILRQTARTSQRPRWIFLERWLPMDSALSRSGLARSVRLRPLLLLALVALLAVATAAYLVGSQNRLPAPFGPAGNGLIAHSDGGDIYVRDALSGTDRLLLGGSGDQRYPDYSPSGQLISYVTTIDGKDHFIVAEKTGANAREIAILPATGNAVAAWSPDSRSIAFIYDVAGIPQLSIAPVDGTSAAVVRLPDLFPYDVAWSPPDGGRLLIKARVAGSEEVGLYTVRPDGSELTSLGLPGQSSYGPSWTLSGSTWSPDGKSVAFNTIIDDASTNGGAYYRVSLASPDGSNVRLLPPVVDDPQFDQAWPIFSPDGKWIAMESWYSQPDGTAENQLAVAPADGSAPARGIGPRIPRQSLVKGWSPDGTRLLLSVVDVGTLYSIDPLTGIAEQLSFTGDLPAWQRLAR